MTVIEFEFRVKDIKDNQYQMYLNRRALTEMRAGRRATTGTKDTTARSIDRLTAVNKTLRQANAIHRSHLVNAACSWPSARA
jgi:hypothetical protein